jgi:hypothetical protein
LLGRTRGATRIRCVLGRIAGSRSTRISLILLGLLLLLLLLLISTRATTTTTSRRRAARVSGRRSSPIDAGVGAVHLRVGDLGGKLNSSMMRPLVCFFVSFIPSRRRITWEITRERERESW